MSARVMGRIRLVETLMATDVALHGPDRPHRASGAILRGPRPPRREPEIATRPAENDSGAVSPAPHVLAGVRSPPCDRAVVDGGIRRSSRPAHRNLLSRPRSRLEGVESLLEPT